MRKMITWLMALIIAIAGVTVCLAMVVHGGLENIVIGLTSLSSSAIISVFLLESIPPRLKTYYTRGGLKIPVNITPDGASQYSQTHKLPLVLYPGQTVKLQHDDGSTEEYVIRGTGKIPSFPDAPDEIFATKSKDIETGDNNIAQWITTEEAKELQSI